MPGMCDYSGKKVAVVGCYSGIGHATAKGLLDLGAEVHGADIRPCDLPLASFTECDTRETGSIDGALKAFGSGIDAFFYCSGLPQTRPPLDVLKVNFLGLRYMIERVRPKIAKDGSVSLIASTAGNGWPQRVETVTDFITTADFDQGVAWAEPRLEELGDPYAFSKEAAIVWTLRQSADFIRSGVRLNCLSPGPTITGMTPDFDSVGPAIIDVYTQPLGRRSTPEEQAWPLIFMGSREASYLNGCNFIVDAGFTAAMTTGQIDLDALLAEAMSADA
ncbi:hypothetical protein MB02_12220 [Croceicoccus estronivorus]|uniref:SDR family oxidoreductase n=1 Tax=Croceicoccus estronivorus TaxID=1172626 RepID=UPI00082BB596|nr:SDR family oxidoreductase [Croceicoccus estronivorus]OCC23377.1 hypothetical protein MB02_12220 [Croceicoccus estronivorus]